MNKKSYKYLIALPVSIIALTGLIRANNTEITAHAHPETHAVTTQSASGKCPFPAADCLRIRKEHAQLQNEIVRLEKELTLEKRLATPQSKKASDLEKKLRQGRETMLRALRKGMTEDDLKQILGRADDIKTDSVGGVWLIYLYTGKDNREHKYRVHLNKSKEVDLWVKVK